MGGERVFEELQMYRQSQAEFVEGVREDSADTPSQRLMMQVGARLLGRSLSASRPPARWLVAAARGSGRRAARADCPLLASHCRRLMPAAAVGGA